MMTTAPALNRRVVRLEWQRQVASQPSDACSATLPEPSMTFKRDVLRKLYDIIAPIRDAGGPLTPRMQGLLRLAEAADAPAEQTGA